MRGKVVNKLGVFGGVFVVKAQDAVSIRASISFPREIYETLEAIAKEKRVSLAWVVREAAEKYIADRWPLFVKPSD